MERKRRRGPLGRLEQLVTTVAKYFSYYTLAVKLAQLLPVLAGVAVVLFSPTAWLSATLRWWAYGGMAAGSAVGMVALALLVSRERGRRRHAVLLLGVFVASAVSLRLHLAVVDVGFAERWSIVQPLQNFYFGSDLGETVYNVVAALWFAVAIFAATVGLPLYVRKRPAAAPHADEGDAARATRAREAIDLLSDELARLHQAVLDARDENAALQGQLEDREQEIEVLRERLERAAREG